MINFSKFTMYQPIKMSGRLVSQCLNVPDDQSFSTLSLQRVGVDSIERPNPETLCQSIDRFLSCGTQINNT